MDIVRKLEANDKGYTLRQTQEIESILDKPDHFKYPIKNTCKKSIGEYYASLEDKLNFLKHISDHPTMPIHDKQYIKEALEHIPTYEKKGFYYGLMNALVIYFAPGVRRLVFYKRTAIASIFLGFWMNWGYNYGRDITYVSTRNIIENWERDMGIRNYQTGL